MKPGISGNYAYATHKKPAVSTAGSLPIFLRLGRLRLWKELKAKAKRSGRKMSDAVFVAKDAKGKLTIGDKKEIDRVAWHKPGPVRLTPTSRYIRDRLFPRKAD
jgi:8-oxo-dGTP diphosphatase